MIFLRFFVGVVKIVSLLCHSVTIDNIKIMISVAFSYTTRQYHSNSSNRVPAEITSYNYIKCTFNDKIPRYVVSP